MRRKERERSREFGLQIIDASDYGVLAVRDTDGEPYALPLSFARDGESLYIHGATEGHKAELFAAPVAVKVVFVGETEVPPVEYGDTPEEKEKLLRNVAKIFTTYFSSAIVEGTLTACEGEEKVHGLRVICEKYTPDRMEYFDAAIQLSIRYTNVYRVDIERITAKSNRVATKPKE